MSALDVGRLADALRVIPVPETQAEWQAAVDRSYEADAALIAAEYDRLAASPRRRTVAGCPVCDADPDGFRPYHDASPRCESGRRNHCSDDRCF
jgi:hypothetical protein